MSEAGDFLARLFQHCTDGWVGVTYLPSRRTEWHSIPLVSPLDDPERLDVEDVYFGVATRKEPLEGGARGGVEDCAVVPALWVDLDFATSEGHKNDRLPTPEQAWRLLATFPLKPNVVVHTGGGIHAYWILTKPLEARPAAGYLKRWYAAWQEHAGELHIDNVYDVPRMMRLPGSLNHKHAPPKAVVAYDEGYRDEPYTLQELALHLPELPAEAEHPRVTSSRPTAPTGPALLERPGDWFDRTISCRQVLEEYADPPWTFKREARQAGEVRGWLYQRPGSSNDVGLQVYADTGNAEVYSSSVPGVEHGRHYTPFGLYALLCHGGSFDEATRGAARMRESSLSVDHRVSGGPPPAGDEITHSTSETSHESGEVSRSLEGLMPNIPEDWWERRPLFRQIRDAALAAIMSPDVLLMCVMTRAAWMTGPGWLVGPLGRRLQPLNLHVALIGKPLTGKSWGLEHSEELVPLPDHLKERWDTRPLSGSGEGLEQAFFEMESKKLVRKRDAILFTEAEGKGFMDILERTGATTDSVLRRLYMSEPTGTSNASTETRGRYMARHSYRACVIVGFQPAQAARIMTKELADTGTPQRFLWTSCTNPMVTPDPPDGPLALPIAALGQPSESGDRYISVPRSIARALYLKAAGAVSGEYEVPEMDEYRHLNQLRIAAMFGIMEGRTTLGINDEDWELAGIVVDTSSKVRDWILTRSRIEEALQRREASERRVRERVAASTYSDRMRTTAERAQARIDSGDFSSWNKLQQSFHSRYREMLDEAREAGLLILPPDWED